jgi:hypothetical protein
LFFGFAPLIFASFARSTALRSARPCDLSSCRLFFFGVDFVGDAPPPAAALAPALPSALASALAAALAPAAAFFAAEIVDRLRGVLRFAARFVARGYKYVRGSESNCEHDSRKM